MFLQPTRRPQPVLPRDRRNNARELIQCRRTDQELSPDSGARPLGSPDVAKSPLTYTGALALLGQRERPLLDKIDKPLGGVILASTPVAGPAVWALIEPKTEAIGIVRSLLNSAKNWTLGTSG